jgi:YgiT-type zinc finger domain-containing protein
MTLESAAGTPPALCPRCQQEMTAETVRAVFWQGARPVIVEGVPALVCRNCVEQYYDEAVSDALRRLAEEGFPDAQAVREERVAVFTLEGRIRERVPLPEDTIVD